MARRNPNLIRKIQQGDIIRAAWLNQTVEQINANTRAIASPKQISPELDAGGDEPTASLGNESFSATITSAETTTVTITDDGGNDHDIERVDEFEAVEDSTGRIMNSSLTYS